VGTTSTDRFNTENLIFFTYYSFAYASFYLFDYSEILGPMDAYKPIFPTQRSVAGRYFINHLTPNGHYSGRTAQLNSRRWILNIYSTNVRTEYFKHAA
jgi:hypothetical protein